MNLFGLFVVGLLLGVSVGFLVVSLGILVVIGGVVVFLRLWGYKVDLLLGLVSQVVSEFGWVQFADDGQLIGLGLCFHRFHAFAWKNNNLQRFS